MTPAHVPLPRRPAWWDRARCAGRGPTTTFFPTEGDSGIAKAWCSACPVRAQCLDRGLEEPDGVWGGLDRNERVRLMKVRAHLQRDEKHPDVGPALAKLVDAGLDATQAHAVLGLSADQVAELCGAHPERSELEVLA